LCTRQISAALSSRSKPRRLVSLCFGGKPDSNRHHSQTATAASGRWTYCCWLREDKDKDWIVDCGLLWRLQSFPCRYPIPACVCTPTRAPDLRSLAHRCILDSWIAGSASNVRSPAAHSASTTVDSFACISSARIQRIQKGGLPQNNRRRKDAFCSAAHNGPGPIHAGLEKLEKGCFQPPGPSKSRAGSHGRTSADRSPP
jgi:hypothetical protein